MQYIDEKYKDASPVRTVETIREILKGLGIEPEETWYDSGIENCWSLRLNVRGAAEPSANGKGVSRDFARASAYGEFMERLQSGLFFYKFQSIERDTAMNLHSYAPDRKYMTTRELIENGEWMDHLIDAYGNGLTREKIARQCLIYACAVDDRVLTIPFYSLFEDKYVYLPAGFAQHMYSANGCCAGNTRAEAWIHALSEIMERRGNIAMLTGGMPAPEIPESALREFPTVRRILDKMKSSGNLDVRILDFSCGTGFPVVASCIIDRDTQRYIVNTGADPVPEIAIQRTLTEIMQGRHIEQIAAGGNSRILNAVKDYPLAHNVLNHLETGNGLFTADFFAGTAAHGLPDFPDHSGKTNEELLPAVLEHFRALGRPVYVRNYSFLNFHCYKFIVPGFSESRALRLHEPIPEYALADIAARVLRQPRTASEADLAILPQLHKRMQTARSRRSNFARLAGIPMERETAADFLLPTLSYAAYRLGRYAEAMDYIDAYLLHGAPDAAKRKHFACIRMYLQFKSAALAEEKIRTVLGRFFDAETVRRFYESMADGGTPYDPHLLDCDPSRCAACPHGAKCSYTLCKNILAAAGKHYSAFAHGQDRENFRF